MRRCTAALTALLALPACSGSGGSAGEGAFRVDTIAGVPHAVNQGEAPAWRLEPERSIGSVGGAGDAPAPDEFGRIRWLALDAEGGVWVADQSIRQIQVFDTAGAHVRTVGRQGSGPGEFLSLQAIGFIGDTLVVQDPSNGRMALLDRSGRHLGEWPMTRMSGTADWFHPLAPDTLAMLDFLPTGAEGNEREDGYVYLGPAGPVDSIIPPPMAERDVVLSIQCNTSDGSLHFWGDPLAPRPLTAPAPGRRVVQGWTDEYRLAFLDAAGDTTLVVERPDVSGAIPDSMRQRLDAEHAEWRDGMPFGASCDPAERGGYDVLPPIEHVAFDETGRMWVETLTDAGRGWEIYSPAGRLLGSAPVPARNENVRPAIRGGRVAVVEEAPEGFHRVVVYRLVEGG